MAQTWLVVFSFQKVGFRPVRDPSVVSISGTQLGYSISEQLAGDIEMLAQSPQSSLFPSHLP